MMSDLLASPCLRNMIRCRSQLLLPPPHTLAQQQCGDKLMLSECHWWLELVLRHFPWYEKWHGTFYGFSLFTAAERWRWHFHSQPFQDLTSVLSQAHCLVRIFSIFSLPIISICIDFPSTLVWIAWTREFELLISSESIRYVVSHPQPFFILLLTILLDLSLCMQIEKFLDLYTSLPSLINYAKSSETALCSCRIH